MLLFPRVLPFVLWLPLHAQVDKEIAPDEKAFLRYMYEQCPQADILQIDRAAGDYVELEYLCGGKIVEMGIRGQEVIFVERETDADEVPLEKIRNTIDKRYPGAFIDEVSMLTVKDTSFLKVEVIQEGIEHNLFFTTDGRNYKPRAALTSDKWSTDILEDLGVRGPQGYDLLKPDSVHELPPILREISGIATTDGRQLFCVQDELGVVFEYDLARGTITNMHRFTDVGDFEDVTLRGGQLLVLRSDGTIFKIEKGGKVDQMLVQLPTLNAEGLYYDPVAKVLLLASKEAAITGPAHTRVVHAIDEHGVASPYLTIDLLELTREFVARFPSLPAGGLVMDPSAIAVHPITGDLYILSAADRLIAVYNEGLKQIFPLPAALFFKPEGLAFLADGTMLISSEGDKKGFTPPSVSVFKYRGR